MPCPPGGRMIAAEKSHREGIIIIKMKEKAALSSKS
jgi:hypothetical protein